MLVRRLVTGLLATTAGLLVAPTVMAQSMVGTEHDFSNAGWNGSGETCIVCHTPHNGDATVAANAPLWNHQLNPAATYTMYQRPLDGAVGASPNALSRLCLSCHDGTIAVDNFGGVTNGTTFVTGNANVGQDLSNDHPISVEYSITSAQTDGGLFNPNTTLVDLASGDGTKTINDGLMDGQNIVECSTCHDVHAEGTTGALLKVNNQGSGLCRTCHTK